MNVTEKMIQDALSTQAGFLVLLNNYGFTYEQFEEYVIAREREINHFESFAPILAPGEYVNNRDKVPAAKIQAQMARKYLELFQLMNQLHSTEAHESKGQTQ